MEIRRLFSSKGSKIILANFAAILVAVVIIIYATLSWLNAYTHHGDSVSVPDVKGMTVDEAINAFHDHDLIGVVVDSMYAKNKPLGIVLECNPMVGSSVKRNRVIRLTINSQSIPLVKLPELVNNSSYRQAELQLRSAGFKLTEPELISGEQDWIYGIRYQGTMINNGQKVPEGATLTLVVGNGNGELSNDSLDAEDDEIAELPKAQTIAPKTTAKDAVDESWF